MKKVIATILLAAFLLSKTACGQAEGEAGNSSRPGASTLPVIDDLPDAPSGGGPNIEGPNAEGSDIDEPGSGGPAGSTFAGLDAAAFDGGVERLFYAGDGKLLVYADDLQLYDTCTGTTLARYTFEGERLSRMDCTPLEDGYAVIGYQPAKTEGGSGLIAAATSAGSTNCYLFDRSLGSVDVLSLEELLPEESVIMAASVSPDGEWIAFSTLDGLYLYSIEGGDVRTVIEDPLSGGEGIGVIGAVAFTQKGTRIAFLGDRYGSVALDGSDLICGEPQGYAMGDQMIGYDTAVWIPEDFTKASGRSLMLDGACREPRIVDFAQGDTGRDGVYGSEQGRYLATAALLETGVRLALYDASTMELIATKEFWDADSSYFARAPRSVCILDDARAGTILCGYDQHTVAFDFSF